MSSSGRKKRATEAGKYLYAFLFPDSIPPIFGRTVRQYQR
jgi:hypothetical protein